MVLELGVACFLVFFLYRVYCMGLGVWLELVWCL